MSCRLVLGLLAVFGAVQAEVRVAGRVTSDTNSPVANAIVVLRAQSGERYRTLTDAAGLFALEVREPGEYAVDAERSGFFALRNQQMTVGGGDLLLVLNPVREFAESINVTSRSSDVALDQTGAQTKLTGTELIEIPYPTTHNLKNAMRILPGVVQDSRGGIHLNGGSEDQVLYLMNGFNVGDPLTGRLESRVSVEAVQSMDVLGGQYSAEYGKSSAGVLSVNTKVGDDRWRYSATNFVPGVENQKGLRIGSWTPRANLSGPILRGRAWFSNSLTTQYDQTVVRELPAGQDRSTSWRHSNLLRAQVNLTPSNILYAGMLTNYFSGPRSGLTALDPVETTQDKRARQWFFDVKDQIYLPRGVVLEAGFASNRTFFRQIPQGSDFYIYTPEGRRGNYFINGIQEGSRDQFIANAFLSSFSLMGEHRIKTGIDLNRVWYSQDLQRGGIEFYNTATLVRRTVYEGGGQLGKSNFETAAYVQDSWRPRKDLLVDLGLRTDWDRILRNWTWSPRAGVAWSPFGRENTKLTGGYAVMFDATNLQLFTRPLDQVPSTTFFPPFGSGNIVQSVFEIPGGRFRSQRYTSLTGSLDQRLWTNVFLKLEATKRRGSRGLMFLDTGTVASQIFALANARADAYDAVGITVRQNFARQYEWLASYTRSRAASNAVLDISADQALLVGSNLGRLPWDSPNRFVSWGYLPTPFKNWSVAYLSEYRTGFPFSVQNDVGFILDGVNSRRYPTFFELNLHIERKFHYRGQQWAARVGMNNLTNRLNANAVINNVDSERFLQYFGGQSRATVFRIRWLGKL